MDPTGGQIEEVMQPNRHGEQLRYHRRWKRLLPERRHGKNAPKAGHHSDSTAVRTGSGVSLTKDLIMMQGDARMRVLVQLTVTSARGNRTLADRRYRLTENLPITHRSACH